MTEEEFFARCIPEPNSGCWLWEGALSSKGYGQLTKRKQKNRTVLAHRFAWELYNGQDIDDAWVLHRCDVRCCVNPAHLFLGTAADNAQDMHRKNRAAPPSGDAHYRTKLTEKDIVVIRADDRRQSDIARSYGVPRQYIWNIKNNRVRKNNT